MRTRNSISKIVSNRQDLSFEQLRIYYDERGKRLNGNFKRSLELITKEGEYNYVAYLLADENNNSIKVAKYSSLDRCDLIENNEYGYCSLIKATKSVLTKLEIENKTAARITPMERVETPLWDRVAVREAVITASVQCAAVEGSYPSSLSHLESHYGLVINHDDYIVNYEWLADNVPPSVTVVPR